jgi:sucrose-6-phosphate hydrolase SacC (GH32 family)
VINNPKFIWYIASIILSLGIQSLLSFEPQSIQASDLAPRAHYKPKDGWIGDVHPIFWGDKWNVFYLEVPHEPLRHGLYGVHSANVVSNDLIHWCEQPVHQEEPNRPWWLIANIVNDGTLYSFYNGENGIHLSTSSDGVTGKPYPGNPVIPYESVDVAQLRDPSIWHNDKTGEFWLILAARKSQDIHHFYSGAFYYSTSRDLSHWSPVKLLYDPGGINVPECPELFSMNEKYYLLGSWGTDRVGMGRYRLSDSPLGPWRRGQTESIDGTDIPAPNTASDGQRRIFFGWIPTYGGGLDYGPSEWGGHLAFPREIWSASDGTLYSRPPSELEMLRSSILSKDMELSSARVIGDWHIIHHGFGTLPGSDYAEILFPATQARLELDCRITLATDCPHAGVIFRAGGSGFPGYEISVDAFHRQLILREHLERRKTLAFQSIDIEPEKPMELRVIVDGSIVEAFLDDRYSLAGRAYVNPGSQSLGFYSDEGEFSVSDLAVYGLKEIFSSSDETRLTTHIQPDITHQPGNCIFFPQASSNVYSAFDPGMNFEGSFTLECWIKPLQGTRGTKRNLIVKGDGTKPGYHYGLNLMWGNCLELYFRTDSGFASLTSPNDSVKEEGKWFHIAGVYDAEHSEMRVYKDGHRIATQESPATHLVSNNTGALRLGCAAGLPAANPYLGLMDEVRLWRVARTDAQILQSFERPLSNDDRTGLIVYWDFEEVQTTGLEGVQRLYSPNKVMKFFGIRAVLFDGAERFGENFINPSEDKWRCE